MILERRTNQGMLRLDGGCFSTREKPSVKDKGEKGPVAANGDGDGDHKGKSQHEKTDEPNHVPSHTTQPGPVNASTPPAVEKTSPLASPGMGKVTYNPITHAPSMWEFICICLVLTKLCLLSFKNFQKGRKLTIIVWLVVKFFCLFTYMLHQVVPDSHQIFP